MLGDELTRLPVDVPSVRVEVRVRLMVDKTVLELLDGDTEAVCAPDTELLVGGETPVDRLAVAGMAVVEIDVKVSGQMVVDIGMIDVKMDAEPESGQLVTEPGQLRTVTSLVE